MAIDITWFKENAWYILLFAILITSLTINLNVALGEPLVFGDEGFYAMHGEYMAENLEIPKNSNPYGESEISPSYLSKTPLTFFTLSSLDLFLGRTGMRAMVPIVSIISALLLFLLVKKLYSTRAGVFASIFYLTMPALVTHTVFLYTEHLSLMFLIGSVYFLYNYFETEEKKDLFLTGILYGFSALTEPTTLVFSLVFAAVLYLYKTDWRNWFQEIIVIGLLCLAVISPWMMNNYVNSGDPGFQISNVINTIPGVEISKPEVTDDLPEFDNEGLASPTETGQGTSASLHKFGIINYAQFAYTLPIFILAVLGFSYYTIEKKSKNWIPILWFVAIFAGVYLLFGGTRVEGLSRNTLFVIAPLAMAAGFFADKLYEYLGSFESTGKTISIIFLVIILGWALVSASTKAESLRPQKQFSPAHFEACDWVRDNTPEDSLLYTLWGHRVEYHCKRGVVTNSDEKVGQALRASDNRTYETLKNHGVDYLFIHKSNIQQEYNKVSYPLSFIRYVESSPNFQQIHSYPQNCLYNQEMNDCAVVYEMVDENETTDQPENIDLGQMMEQG